MIDTITGLGVGFLAGCLTTLMLRRAEEGKALLPGRPRSAEDRERDVMAGALEHRLSLGPRIVVIGGGTGLSTLLAGLKAFSRNLTAVVTVTDEGGSSGRLRQEWGVLPPGDVRNCLVALAENDSSLQRILGFRFDRGELAGHSLGNLILLAATELTGDFQKAVEEMNRLLAIRGRVLPVTTESVVLVGELDQGERVRGEKEVSENGWRLRRLWLEPQNARPLGEVIEATLRADLIVLGPGSLFTSILPNLLLEEYARVVREAPAPKVYVSNLMTQPRETQGMSLSAHVDWLAGVLDRMPDAVIANRSAVPEGILARYRDQGATPIYLSSKEEERLHRAGIRVVQGDLLEIRPGALLRHQAQNLSEILVRLAREAKERGTWRH
jgi:uncharacterized cofD-like protein